jgi:hypothetical protein
MQQLDWKDHFMRAAGLANMVTVAADHVTDPETKAGLVAVAKAIDGYIETAGRMVAAELGK